MPRRVPESATYAMTKSRAHVESIFVERASPDTELFKWCAHDDVYEPTYLERCVAELDERPEVVACHSRVRYINERGDELMRSFRQLDYTDDRPWVRFNQILCARMTTPTGLP